ncbi:calcium-binding protein [Aliigemmobacter aestuarii]|uniref:Calcium-binding protein n=1 Tax=Aliigemmobacter aestuarii TaxID=1445661 RepID=A0A4S3MMG5_9RHOB|nr:calcium-binding protein [Gemmobacter aestuarii]THD82871.1 calcium-binding protein [Gemmobacter aestuarii]
MPTNDQLDSSLDSLAPFLPLLTAGGYTGPTTVNAVLNLTVGQFRALLDDIPPLLRTIPAAVWQNALSSTPPGPARTALQQFANGNFSLIEDALDTARAALSGYPPSTTLRDALEGLGVDTLPFEYDIPAFADFGLPEALRGGGFTWETPEFTIDANGNWSYLGYSGNGVDGFDARGSGGLAGLWVGAANLIGAMYFEAIEAGLRSAGIANPGRVATNATNAAALMEFQDTATELMETLLGGTNLARFARNAETQLLQAGRDVVLNGDAFFDGLLRLVGYSVSQSDVVFGMHSGSGLRSFGNHRDTYLGGAAGDRVNLGGRDDRAFGLAGNDRLKGQSGNDVLFGGSGSDRLFGGNGKDRIDGGNGKDRIDGGKGNDKLTGGFGADDFVYNGGADRITDFSARQNDEIVLNRGALGLGNRTAEQVVRAFAEDAGTSVVFDFGDGNTLTLARVGSLAGLADDIILV